jgi:hypothetical protein
MAQFTRMSLCHLFYSVSIPCNLCALFRPTDGLRTTHDRVPNTDYPIAAS